MANIETLEDSPSRENNRARRGWKNRYDGLQWNRLNRWLSSQVNRPVDKVFSEFVKLPWLGARHRTSEVFYNRVEREVVMIDKVPHTPGLRGQMTSLTSCFRDKLYVHPVSKLLLRATHDISKKDRQEAYKAMWANKDLLHLGDYEQLVRENGYWFKVTMPASAEINTTVQVDAHTLMVATKIVKAIPKKHYRDQPYPICSRRTKVSLSRKELCFHGLKNQRP